MVNIGFGKDGKGAILYDSISTDMGALAANDVAEILGQYHDVLVDDFRIIKTEYFVSVNGAQAIVLEDGPLLFGMADAALTGAQIEECLESVVLNRGAVPEEEQAMRPVWPLEIFTLMDVDAGNGAMKPGPLKGSFNPRWTFRNPEGFTYWVYNMSSAAIATGSVIEGLFKHFGVWLT